MVCKASTPHECVLARVKFSITGDYVGDDKVKFVFKKHKPTQTALRDIEKGNRKLLFF